MAKTLQIVTHAYRCTIEEQDDPTVWITHALEGAGADLGVLLRGNAVNSAVQGQDASGLSFGSMVQTQPPRIDRDVAALLAKGIDVYVVSCDARERGLEDASFVEGIKTVERSGVAGLMDQFDRVWSW